MALLAERLALVIGVKGEPYVLVVKGRPLLSNLTNRSEEHANSAILLPEHGAVGFLFKALVKQGT